jgi:hypothetical protein
VLGNHLEKRGASARHFGTKLLYREHIGQDDRLGVGICRKGLTLAVENRRTAHAVQRFFFERPSVYSRSEMGCVSCGFR